MSEKYDLIIIGGGPGGLAAAEFPQQRKKEPSLSKKTVGAAPALTEVVSPPKRFFPAASIMLF